MVFRRSGVQAQERPLTSTTARHSDSRGGAKVEELFPQLICRAKSYFLDPQSERAAAETISSAWLSVMTPSARKCSTTCATVETYWPWFFQVPPEAGPEQGAN